MTESFQQLVGWSCVISAASFFVFTLAVSLRLFARIETDKEESK